MAAWLKVPKPDGRTFFIQVDKVNAIAPKEEGKCIIYCLGVSIEVGLPEEEIYAKIEKLVNDEYVESCKRQAAITKYGGDNVVAAMREIMGKY